MCDSGKVSLLTTNKIMSVAMLAAGLCFWPALGFAQPAPPLAMPQQPPATAPGSVAAPNGFDITLPGAAPAAGNVPMPPAADQFNVDQATLQKQAEVAAAEAAVQAEKARKIEDHNRESYSRASSGLLPLSPDQIRDFMRRMETTQEAGQQPFAGPPKPEVKITTLSLDPGIDPPVINLAAGYVTTVNMVDLTGEPWPILDVGVGGSFEVTPTQAGSHIVRIMPLTRLATGNLSIILKDLPTPVIFRLSAGGATVHMRYDTRIAKNGPNAKPSLIGGGRGVTAGDDTIVAILENAPPKDAKRLKVAGLDARTMAWQLNDKVFLRTPLTLLSPAWNASTASSDGMTVYEIGDAPVLLMSDNGAMVRARLLRDDAGK